MTQTKIFVATGLYIYNTIFNTYIFAIWCSVTILGGITKCSHVVHWCISGFLYQSHASISPEDAHVGFLKSVDDPKMILTFKRYPDPFDVVALQMFVDYFTDQFVANTLLKGKVSFNCLIFWFLAWKNRWEDANPLVRKRNASRSPHVQIRGSAQAENSNRFVDTVLDSIDGKLRGPPPESYVSPRK